ncbi:MAG: hypothetical protein J1G38_01395 [Clostridiales bacterium]|nr:hypothetical protein [Clostridiales bacterium]
MAERRGKRDDEREERRQRIISIICYVVAAVGGLGVVASAVAYSLTRKDVLFIPLALCAVVCMISFTYARLRSR